jgi:transcriptional regulator with XRE-family HTH domain
MRVRLRWRQVDLAGRLGLSRAFVSKVERGRIRNVRLELLEGLCHELGADLDVRIRWRGEGLDRLLDEAHAGLVERVVELLHADGWEVALEVTFNHYGDRGSADVVGWHAPTRSVLIIEVKSVVADAQGTLSPLDRKTRLGFAIARSRGWDAATVSRLLVVREGSVNRRRMARLASSFDAALPDRNRAIRRWLRQPTGSIAGLLFLPDATPGSARHGSTARQRVNRPRRGPDRPG